MVRSLEGIATDLDGSTGSRVSAPSKGASVIYLLFVLGFVLLIKGGETLVTGSSSVAKRFGISDLVVGLTVVAFGTSAPEFIVNVLASHSGNAEIAIGNVVGSNIANVLLILGLTAIFCPLPIRDRTLIAEIPFSLLAATLVGFLANANLFGSSTGLCLSRGDGGVLLFFFLLFMAYVFRISKEATGEGSGEEEIVVLSIRRSVILILVGIGALFLGGKWVVDGAVFIAKSFGLSESFVGLTIVAIGTSLPELVTSIIAARQCKTDIAVGNAIGSNIFNILWVLGASAVVNPLPFSVITNTDILVVIFSGCLLIMCMATGIRNTVDRSNGMLFTFLYIAYLAFCGYRG